MIAGAAADAARRPARRGLPVRILLSLLVLAALLPALGLAAALAVRFAGTERAALQRGGRDAALLLAGAIDRQVAAVEATLTALAASPTLESGDLAGIHAQVSRLRGVAGNDLVLADAAGQHLLSTSVPWGEKLPPLRLAEPFRIAAAAGRRVVSGVAQGALAPGPIVLVVVPARLGPDATPVGLGARLDALATWGPLLRAVRTGLPDGASASIIDAEALIVGRDPDPERFTALPIPPAFAAALAAARAGGAQEGWIADQVNRDGARVHVAWRLVPETGWTAVVSVPDSAIDGLLRRALWPLLGGGGVLLVLGLALAQWLSLRLALPLRALAAGARPQGGSGVAEIDALGTALAAAERRRADAEEALRISEAQLRLAFDHARLGYFSWDATTDRVELSRRAAEIFGLPTPTPDLTWAAIRERLHPGDRERARAEVERVLLERADYTIEYRVGREDELGEAWVAALGRGRYAEGDGTPLGMIGVVQDITARKSAEAALRDERDRAQRYFEAAKTTLLVLDAQHRLREVNAAGCALLGADREALLGRPWAANFLPPEDREAVAKRLAAFAAGEDPPPLFEGRVLRMDGEIRLVDWRTLALRDHDGRYTGLLSSGEDVTERRAAAERQSLLAREVDHRARNALAVVQAVVRLTQAPTVDAFARAVEGRVAALARAHGLLTEKRWRAADLRQLLERELAPFADGTSAVTLFGPAVAIRPAAVQAVAMALHELATNAAKYGALSVPEGRLHVAWDVAAGGNLGIEWRERGGPAAAEPERRGFGTRVLDATLREQLDGSVERVWSVAGLTVRIAIPVQHLVPEAA